MKIVSEQELSAARQAQQFLEQLGLESNSEQSQACYGLAVLLMKSWLSYAPSGSNSLQNSDQSWKEFQSQVKVWSLKNVTQNLGFYSTKGTNIL